MTTEQPIDLTDFKFNCPFCDQHLACVSSQRGTQIQCPSCQNDITVPPTIHLAGHSGLLWTPLLPQRSPDPAGSSTAEAKGQLSKEDADHWYQ